MDRADLTREGGSFTVQGFLKATDHSDLVASRKTLCSFAGTVGLVVHPDRWGHRVGCASLLLLCAAACAGLEVATWLILPVVIRSSQRLSHARLSKSNFTVKLRMAHYISYSLLDSTLLLGYP